jgi:hypothetical protein
MARVAYGNPLCNRFAYELLFYVVL